MIRVYHLIGVTDAGSVQVEYSTRRSWSGSGRSGVCLIGKQKKPILFKVTEARCLWIFLLTTPLPLETISRGVYVYLYHWQLKKILTHFYPVAEKIVITHSKPEHHCEAINTLTHTHKHTHTHLCMYEYRYIRVCMDINMCLRVYASLLQLFEDSAQTVLISSEDNEARPWFFSLSSFWDNMCLRLYGPKWPQVSEREREGGRERERLNIYTLWDISTVYIQW